MSRSFTLSPFRPPLATPALNEAERLRLARELENYLEPLLAYCDQQEANDDLTEAEFKHVFALREVVAALGRYDANAEELLTYYRQGLSAARQQAAAQVPSLDEALGLPPASTPESDRASDPLYRLGWVRGFRKAQTQYEHVTSLYAQYATLTPPPSYQPSPLIQRLQAYLASPAAQQYATLPETTRQAIPHLPLPSPDAEPEQAAA